MQRVFVTTASYRYEELKPRVFEMLESLGGTRIRTGSRVLVKPNLLAPATPERAMLTHPLLVRAACEYALDHGAKVQVSDSPAIGPFARIVRENRLASALDGLDVNLSEFTRSRTMEVGGPFKHIDIADEALDADFMINLPKLKTHSQMLLTLAIKNLFGCVVGFRKPEWHLRAGIERERFALVLVQIYEILRPAFTLLDGILAMEGQGPGRGGTPRPVGVLMGSANALALDMTVCQMLGMDPVRVLTNKVALERGGDGEPIEVVGELPPVDPLRLPEETSLLFGPPSVHGILRRQFIQRPVVAGDRCKRCGECWNYCPVSAISLKDRELRFDYDRCIRCYCCIEVCPHGALRAEEPLGGRVLKTIHGLLGNLVDKKSAGGRSAVRRE